MFHISANNHRLLIHIRIISLIRFQRVLKNSYVLKKVLFPQQRIQQGTESVKGAEFLGQANYCKFGNFREGLFSRNFAFAKFREIKTLAKWQNHSVVY